MPDPYGPALSFLTSLDISYKIAKDRRDKLNTGALDASPAEMQGRSAAPGPLEPDPGNAGVGSDLVDISSVSL